MGIYDGGDSNFGIIDDINIKQNYAEFEQGFDFVDVLKKYHCISVPDDMLESWMAELNDLQTYFGSYNRPEKGLSRWGVTLIPPTSLKRFIKTITEKTTEEYANSSEYLDLIILLRKANDDKKFVIHFGV